MNSDAIWIVFVFLSPLLFVQKKIRLCGYNLCLSKFVFVLLFFVSFVFVLTLLIDYNSIGAYGHTLFGNNNGSSVQIQKNGNFQVELSTVPPKPLLHKNTDIFLRITSTAGDELIELPVYLSLGKDGKISSISSPSSSSNLTMVRSGHHNFNTVFSDQGKYLLFLDIKDIYYTGSILHFIFELNVEMPVVDQFYDLLKTFFINYFYIYVPILLLLVFVLIFKHYKKNRLLKNGVR
jgi:hypothetical protein